MIQNVFVLPVSIEAPVFKSASNDHEPVPESAKKVQFKEDDLRKQPSLKATEAAVEPQPLQNQNKVSRSIK